MQTVLELLVRASCTYLVLLLILRLSGKRVIGEGTPFDLVVALIVGDFPDDMIWGQVPFGQGVAAIGTIMLLHVVVTYVGSRNTLLHDLVASVPLPVVWGGRPVARALAREHVNELELASLLRGHEVEHVSDIAEARLEPTGTLSIRRVAGAQPLTGRDREKLREVLG